MSRGQTDLGKKRNRDAVVRKKAPVLVYEEVGRDFEDSREPTKFYGFKDDYKSENPSNNVPNFALMIYDRKNQRFRLIPVKNHIKFEKAKQ